MRSAWWSFQRRQKNVKYEIPSIRCIYMGKSLTTNSLLFYEKNIYKVQSFFYSKKKIFFLILTISSCNKHIPLPIPISSIRYPIVIFIWSYHIWCTQGYTQISIVYLVHAGDDQKNQNIDRISIVSSLFFL